MEDIEYFKNTLYKNSKGFISLAYANEKIGWNEYIYKVKDLGTQLTLFENDSNVNIYSSVNTFYNPKRNFENLYNLNSIFCDIDCVKYDNISIKRAFKELIAMWSNGIIPEPSMVVDSGNGLHVYWNLEKCYASTKDNVSFVPTYQALLDTFTRKLAFLGADFKSAEPSRVLGVPSTYNIKSATQRKIIYPILNIKILYVKELRYKIIDLAQTYLSKRESVEKKVIYEKRKILFNELTLAHARMEDYKKLINIRNKYMPEGYRNQLLYNYGLENIDYTKTKVNLEESLIEINSMFNKPINSRELKGIIKSLEGSKFKKIKNQTIIEQLGISSQEQEKMRTLIEREIKISRYVEKKKKAIRNENGLTKREQNREDNKYLILDGYYLQNKKIKEISNNLKISQSLVKYYLFEDITIKDKVLFLIDNKVSKRNIMKKLKLTQYMITKFLKNDTLK